MIEQIHAMMQAISIETTPAVNLWMYWMNLIFLASVFFIANNSGARYALLAMLIALPTAPIIYGLTGSIHLLGIAHILFWSPVAYYMVMQEMRGLSFKVSSPYGIWVLLLTATILISLAFDFRNIYLVLAGQK